MNRMGATASRFWRGETGRSDSVRDQRAQPAALAERWSGWVELAAAFAFETDSEGRFTALHPQSVLGWSAGALLGEPACGLLADGAEDPFRPRPGRRQVGVGLRGADGAVTRLRLSLAPVLDAAGQLAGTRGTAVAEADAAGELALRRAALLDHLLGQIQTEILPSRMMPAALSGLMQLLGAEGALVLDNKAGEGGQGLLHSVGRGADAVVAAGRRLVDQVSTGRLRGSADGREVLMAPLQTRFGGHASVVLWRPAPAWQDADAAVLTAAGGLLRMVLEGEHIQSEMARQARTDLLTGLFNRRAFLDEVTRRIDRLDREQAPGVLMLVDLDGFRALNDRVGHEVGDEALRLAAQLLRRTVRPADLVARLGGDEFALWLDGADELTAAERAESLRTESPRELSQLTGGDLLAEDGPGLGMSVGIAMRWPRNADEIDTLMRNADHALQDVRRRGGGQWKVFH